MTFLTGTQHLSAALVHHTGSMIRFRPAQLQYLPTQDVDCSVTLLDGRNVKGRFHRHPANPYIGGPELVGWIKTWVLWNEPVSIVVEQVGRGLGIRLRTRSGGQPHTALSRRIRRKAVGLGKIKSAARRRRAYSAWEHDPRLRQLVLQVWLPQCQVVGCGASQGLPSTLADTIVDVHHIEFVSSGGSDSPTNLCLLCANHHALVHRAPTRQILLNSSERVSIAVNGTVITIERDVAELWRLIDV